MDELVRLSQACRDLSAFSLKALYLACQHGHVPELVALSLDDGQVQLIGGLLAQPEGRCQIESAIDAEVRLRTRERMH